MEDGKGAPCKEGSADGWDPREMHVLLHLNPNTSSPPRCQPHRSGVPPPPTQHLTPAPAMPPPLGMFHLR
jgi:hypothetical protein